LHVVVAAPIRQGCSDDRRSRKNRHSAAPAAHGLGTTARTELGILCLWSRQCQRFRSTQDLLEKAGIAQVVRSFFLDGSQDRQRWTGVPTPTHRPLLSLAAPTDLRVLVRVLRLEPRPGFAAQGLVVAPGLIERPYVFDGNDLPGVMLATAVRRLVNLYSVRPGRRAVVFTANEERVAAAEDLDDIGVEVVRVVDARRGEAIRRARGMGHVSAVELEDGSEIACDLLVTAVGWTLPRHY
jgi:hypothetical protein